MVLVRWVSVALLRGTGGMMGTQQTSQSLVSLCGRCGGVMHSVLQQKIGAGGNTGAPLSSVPVATAGGVSSVIAPPPVVDPTSPSTNRTIPLFQANLQPQPPQPPETIVTEQDRMLQVNYENWLQQQNTVLTNQLKYYETEIVKLRKVKKQLNTKQRQQRKHGNELAEGDAKELQKTTADHTVIQKQLENARRQQRQHSVILQDYKAKHPSAAAKMLGGTGPPTPRLVLCLSIVTFLLMPANVALA
uniref:Putative histone-lysine n-methyltransferase 2c n=1 Tax=Anopheles marajoara TaxID=58244 RepID=A0A2M4C5I1_9DIPT